MKVFLTIALLCTYSGLIAQSTSTTNRLQKQWETPAVLKTPESVLYDEETGMIYVSNIDGSPSKKDSSGFISTLSADGTILNLEWVKGIDAPKGMTIYKNHLYVTNIDEVVEIEILSASIVKRYPIEGSAFLNDIAVDIKTGLLFISDTQTGKVHLLQNGKVFTWLEGDMFKGANGLCVRDGILYIGAENSILKANIASGEIVVSGVNTGRVDGIYVTAEKKYIFSDWKGSISLTTSFMPKPELLLNTTPQNINAADFGVILSKQMILVPTFADNRVICYTLSDIK